MPAFGKIRYTYAPVASAATTYHEEELVFVLNANDPSILEVFTNCANWCRQLEEHGAERIPTPKGEYHSLRGTLAQYLDALYVLKARQVRFLSVDELKRDLVYRRRERKRKEASLTEAEKERRAKRAALAKAWRDRQSPEKRQQMREQSSRARKKATPYELDLRRH